VYLRRHFDEDGRDYAFLVDEAHNLVDRAREMFSADLTTREILDVRRALKHPLPRCARALGKVSTALRQLHGAEEEEPDAASGRSESGTLDLWEAGRSANVELETGGDDHDHPACRPAAGLPDTLGRVLDDALKEAEAWLARNEPADFRAALLELYFRLRSFRRTVELYDERYATLTHLDEGVSVRLFCLDPSHLLRQALARGKAAVFFSATLTPADYYRDLLGGEAGDPELRLNSPFPPANLAVLVQHRIRTQFKARAKTLDDVAQTIEAVTAERNGNYLVYLPSYHYLTAVHERFQARRPETRTLAQRPGMNEAEREDFLRAFTAVHSQTLVGFAVMGGIFGEGIDLVGDRLIGAVIVGVGLPQICLERDLIRDYFQARTGAGFEYAYTFPGMNRVLQAVGRVIRSETDRGLVLLVDTRFAEPRYRRLFPSWWQPVRTGSVEEIRRAAGRFWNPQA
jgi:DNA excision repair protein ERCC-2